MLDHHKNPNISYFHAFGCQCFILKTKGNLGKFNSRSDEGIMLGYLETTEVFKAYYSRMSKVEEAIHEKFNENELDNKMLELDYAFFNLHISDKASNARNESKESEISKQEV